MDERVCPDPLFDRLHRLAARGVTGRGYTDAITIDVSRLRRAFPTLTQGARAAVEALAQSMDAALDSRPKETGHPATETEYPMDPRDPTAMFQSAHRNVDMPYPWNNVPPSDEPLTDVRLMDTLGPILAHVAGLTQLLVVAKQDEVLPDQLRAVHGLLAAQTRAAQALLRRWWGDREDD